MCNHCFYFEQCGSVFFFVLFVLLRFSVFFSAPSRPLNCYPIDCGEMQLPDLLMLLGETQNLEHIQQQQLRACLLLPGMLQLYWINNGWSGTFHAYAITHLEGVRHSRIKRRRRRWRNVQVLTWWQGCGGCEGGSTAWRPTRKRMKQLNHRARAHTHTHTHTPLTKQVQAWLGELCFSSEKRSPQGYGF